jgi:DNA-binding MarR family transcriptional regulator
MRSIPGPKAEAVQPARTADRRAVSASIIAQFRAALRELRCAGGDRMRRAGLSFTHFHILSLLDRHGEMPMSRLADMLDVSLSNTSGVIDRLEERGLVERIRVPDDRRIVLVRPSDIGRRALGEAEVLKDEMVQQVLDRLDAAQLDRLARAVDDLQGAAIAAFPDLTQHDHVH